MGIVNLITIIMLVTSLGHRTAALDFEECASAPQMGVYVASSSNCSKYIYCAGPGSFEAECLDGHYYEEKLERCVDKELVKRCQDPMASTTKSPLVVKKPPIPAQKADPLTITLRLLPNAGPCYPYMVCYEGAGLAKACTPASTMSTVVSGMEATLMEASVQLTAALGQLITKVKSWKTITGNDAGHTCPA